MKKQLVLFAREDLKIQSYVLYTRVTEECEVLTGHARHHGSDPQNALWNTSKISHTATAWLWLLMIYENGQAHENKFAICSSKVTSKMTLPEQR